MKAGNKMKKIVLIIALTLSVFANDIIVKDSSCSVKETVAKIRNIVEKKGLNVFAIINHSGNAKMVGMKLEKSIMVIFGNPKLGTALMQQDMTVGLDLPLRILVYEDKEGNVKMAYRDGTWLETKHILNRPKLVAKVNKGMDKITTKAGICR